MSLSAYRFPLFVDLNGQKAVVVGGGKIALRRANVLVSFGAEVTIIAPECAEVPEGARYLKRRYQTGDLDGAFLAVAATNSREVNRLVGLDAKEQGIFVTVADCKEEGNFYFPAICMGGGLVAGLVSRGEAHSKTAETARKIRTVLEESE